MELADSLADDVDVVDLLTALATRDVGLLGVTADGAPLSEGDLTEARTFADLVSISVVQHRAARERQQVNEQLTYDLGRRVVLAQAWALSTPLPLRARTRRENAAALASRRPR